VLEELEYTNKIP